jgi:hypothetical protein
MFILVCDVYTLRLFYNLCEILHKNLLWMKININLCKCPWISHRIVRPSTSKIANSLFTILVTSFVVRVLEFILELIFLAMASFSCMDSCKSISSSAVSLSDSNSNGYFSFSYKQQKAFMSISLTLLSIMQIILFSLQSS